MIVLDACVLIAHLDTVDAHHDRATRLLASLVGQPKVVSILTLAELRAHTGLTMPDCCVLLTAERALATLATFDDRLARVATDRGLTIAPGTS